MQKAKAKLESLLTAEQDRGFFTAYYAEAGRLDEGAARYQLGESQRFFDLASLTKALVTGPLVHEVLRSKGLPLSAPLHQWAKLHQQFAPPIEGLSTESLLAHRSGLPAWRNFWLAQLGPQLVPKAERMHPLIPQVFARSARLGEPGDVYSDLGYLLLGYALEAASGLRLDALWSRFAENLGLDTGALGYASQIHGGQADFVPSASCALRERLLQGEVHDENCAALGGIAGHAGLFASGPAVGAYLRRLFHANEGRAYLEANLQAMAQHAFEGLLGLRRGHGTSAALFAEGQGMGHLGFVGTAFWLDLPSRRYAILLTNRVISGRVDARITAIRREAFGYLDALA